MARFEIFDTIDRFRQEGQPFCVATIVRTADVTSAKAGAKAAITGAGEIVGHLGGSCVQRAVRQAAAEALQSGETRMIRVKPSEKVVSMQDADGVQLYKSGCPSGGTVDLLIEPYRQPPQLVIFGTTPIAQALAQHAALLGYSVAVSEDARTDARTDDGTDGGPRSFTGTDLTPLALDPADFVVVASQGQGDLAALRAAVQSRARHVSLVASKKKAATLIEKLAAEGVPRDRLAQVKSPAGLDLGGIDPHEIAVSVMAEVIRWRNANQTGGGLREEDGRG